MGVIPDGLSDLEVLHLASESGRVLGSPDVRTMPANFQAFIVQKEPPGLILVPRSRTITQTVEGLLLVWLDWSPEQLKNQAIWLPGTSL